MSDAAATTAWHADQRARITSYRPVRPQMPNEHRCAATGCAEPPPPLPAGVEGFTVPTGIVAPLLVAAAALITLVVVLRKRT
jgi:hypothetical protein